MLQGKAVIVTGSSRGIGKSIALAAARQGASVVVNAVSQVQRAEQVAEEIRALGAPVQVVLADISDPVQVERLFATTLDRFGRLDVLVNNAAAFVDPTIAMDMPLTDWTRVLGVNLTGAFLAAQAAARHMCEQRSGVIINISSAGSRTPMTGDVAYIGSKGGLEAMNRALAVDLAPYGVRAIGVAPGHCDTPENVEWLEASPERKVKVLDRIPMHRLGRTEEIAELVTFLASDACCYLTGETIFVDGGLTIWGGSFE